MTTAALSELLEKLEREATKGPWERSPEDPEDYAPDEDEEYCILAGGLDITNGGVLDRGDAALIVALVNNLALIRACVELAEAVDNTKADLSDDVWDALSKVRAAKEGK